MAARKWTEQQRKNQSLAIRRWKPWLKSTGAKTDEGKLIVSRNAIKDGESLNHRRFFRALNKLLEMQRKTIKLARELC